ncbi:branched-chain amino acid ABC transporter permease [Desulfoferula mesophila]|uniref:Branched-chain amino acid ABC transporter permease n=1 Tax=Desulfoferula mesophila TaxID=3058419 RepID=A0AAU9EED0_9BACT|nr:branched-chain amino acid ABC transporter permease [Desulfoferula mesophilus]
MISTIAYGLTLGGILYIISIGLSLTFGTMRIVNFAHALVYTVGAYVLVAVMPMLGGWFAPAAIFAVLGVIPLAWVIERFVVRSLYGESIDYAIIATYAVLLIGVDAIKWIWGATPIPLSDPINASVGFFGVDLPVYRLLIIGLSLLVALGMELFFNKTIIGKIVVAGLEDKEATLSLGINVAKYFSIVFVLGSCLAALGGVLYAPITTVHPYMGFQVLLLSFAVVLVGGLGSIRGTLISAFALGMVMSVTGRIWGPASEAMVFFVMAIVLVFKPVEV